MADEEQHTGVGVFLIPEVSDPVVAASSEPAHLTTVWLGDMNDLDGGTIAAIRGEVAAYSAVLEGPVVVPVTERGTLGDDDADVAFLERTDALLALRDGLLEASPTVKRVMESVEQFPEWTPHVTLGYPETPAAGEYDGDAVTFDRIGLWVGPDQEDYPMGAEKKPLLATGGIVTPGTMPLVAGGVGSPDYVVPLRAIREACEKMALIAAGGGWVAPAEQVEELEIDDVDDEMPTDELEDDEEEITEIPVHGVATVEGRATGDGRGFRLEALQLGAMPQPLGYEYVSTHGGDTSNVAIVGRIDSYERKELADGVVELRWRGVIFPGKEYGAKAIESIVDGSYTGLSVVVDDVTLDVEEEREAMRQRLLEERGVDEGEKVDEDFDIEKMLDLYVGDGTQSTTWFKSARVRRFDMVPTGAFQEAYIALGHEFADELSEEAVVAAAQALEDCGCLDDIETVDLSHLTEEQLAEYEALSDEEQLTYAHEHGAIVASAAEFRQWAEAQPGAVFEPSRGLVTLASGEVVYAPGTKDGPGWITHPIPTARIRRYWVRGKGAAKIKWGVPGDFNRCRAQLAKYVQNPDWLAGLCANMHKEAIGVWPGQEGGDRHSLREAHYQSLLASGLSSTEAHGTAWPEPAPLFSLVAAAAPLDASYFERRELQNPRVGIVVDGDAVYGYVAQWNVCHIGMQDDCTLAPHSPSNYGQYRTGTVMTTKGPVPVGQITMNTGHARGDLSARSTVAHYDNTGTAVADVACGEDRFGIWFAGKIRPNVSEEDRFALAASGRLSGDWRVIGGAYELVAALVVNVPGFSIPDVSITASADLGPVSLVAAGVIRPEDIDVPVENEGFATLEPFEPLTVEMVAGIATAAAEQVLFAQKREAMLDSLAPARAALSAYLLSNARAKLAEITKE